MYVEQLESETAAADPALRRDAGTWLGGNRFTDDFLLTLGVSLFPL